MSAVNGRVEKKILTRDFAESTSSRLILPSRTEHVIAAHGMDVSAVEQLVQGSMVADEFRPVSRFIFAGESYYKSLGNAVAREDGCLLQLREMTGSGGGISSIQVTSISGPSLFPLRQQGRNIGVVYEDEDARYCRLSGLLPLVLAASREEQTRAVLEMMEWILLTNGFTFTDTVRTWFYLDHLLDWYREFNEVRTGFFSERGIFDRLVPASTGIGATNPWGAALICDLLAVQPKSQDIVIRAVDSPLQDSALKYASSFSRAVEIRMPSHRTLMISGTASIDGAGNTQYPGESGRQIERTLEVVTALLKAEGMDWNDVTRGIAYFVDMKDIAAFKSLCSRFDMPLFPLALAHADICRHSLTFEIEVDAVKA